MAARRRGEDIIDFSMGNPDGATPPHIVEKLCQVAQRDDTHGYSTSRGIPRLRRAISRWYADRYAVDIDPESEAVGGIASLASIGDTDWWRIPDTHSAARYAGGGASIRWTRDRGKRDPRKLPAG